MYTPKRRVTRKAIVDYFGERGIPLEPRWIKLATVGTYKPEGEEPFEALAVQIKIPERYDGFCWCSTDPGKADVLVGMEVYTEIPEAEARLDK